MSTHAELTFGRPLPSDIARASTKIGFFNNPQVGKLLGHRRHRTTAGYAHLANGHLVEAAEKVGTIIANAMADVGSDSSANAG